MIMKLPMPERSRLVTMPNTLMPPNMPAVTMKACATEEPVYTSRTGPRNTPMSTEYSRNRPVAVPAESTCILAVMNMERPMTATMSRTIMMVLVNRNCMMAMLEAVNTAARAVTPRATVIQR